MINLFGESVTGGLVFAVESTMQQKVHEEYWLPVRKRYAGQCFCQRAFVAICISYCCTLLEVCQCNKTKLYKTSLRRAIESIYATLK